MRINKAKNMVQSVMESTVKAYSDIFSVAGENQIRISDMTINLIPCSNGSVLVTDDKFSTEVIGMEFHDDPTTLFFDIIRRAKMLMSYETINNVEICQSSFNDVSLKYILKELIVN